MKLVAKARMFIEDKWRDAGHVFDAEPEDVQPSLDAGTVEEYDVNKHGELPEEVDPEKEAHPAAPSDPAPPAPEKKQGDQGGAK